MVIVFHTIAALFDYVSTGLVLRTFMHCSVTFRSRQEAASDAISGAFMQYIVPNNAVLVLGVLLG